MNRVTLHLAECIYTVPSRDILVSTCFGKGKLSRLDAVFVIRGV